MADIINTLAGASSEIEKLRNARPDALHNAQASFAALLEPDDPGNFSYAERYAVAAFTASLFGEEKTAEFYFDLLADEADEDLIAAVQAASARGASTGPYRGGGFVVFGDADGQANEDGKSPLGARLAAAFSWAHLVVFHPKDASPQVLGHLDAAGWSATEIVSLAQLVAFLAFQVRVVHGLRVMAGQNPRTPTVDRVPGTQDTGWEVTPNIVEYDSVVPEHFVNHPLGWLPWIAPLEKEELTEKHIDALIKPERAGIAYFRLLARDPDALKARTLTDLDIFYNTDGGLSRADRELAATVVSRYNGCEYCATVHQARCIDEGGEPAAVQRLLDDGIEADLGSEKWDLIRRTSVALTSTPFDFDAAQCAELREHGFDEQSILDLIYSSAFFNWANRLMLALGQPEVPKRYR
ncbi:alkylhydroperoxidase domain protein [Corynebacterium propinquum]|jgi:peroxidase-like protein|uniref:alkylhydroperoxidase domain protein n=1 Tax=Corynebacterium propinquum TaxID=43769 RepID=UPI0021AE66B3|nr:alkylhydroperoxidase domain protein [Corynebacterium propinquum]MCT1817631.1 alkylhydroperoxidase domain protein [Corynebacterium propinquum]